MTKFLLEECVLICYNESCKDKQMEDARLWRRCRERKHCTDWNAGSRKEHGWGCAGKETWLSLSGFRSCYSGADKKLLHELITEHGVDGFLKIEEDINAGLDCEQAVIATGGSVIYGEKAMEHLRKIGCVVYLKLSYKEIEDRLGDLTARGVALKNGQTLKDLYNERCPLYEKYAHIVQECDHKRVREIVQELASKANA